MVGDGLQQDVELTALYKDAILNYGEGKVLGILASRYDMGLEQHRRRRAADEPTTDTPTDEPVQNNYIYVASKRKNFRNFYHLIVFTKRFLMVFHRYRRFDLDCGATSIKSWSE